jgi:hypothetical protein
VPTPAPKLEPKPEPELKDPSPAELQTRYGHSSDALHALLAHPGSSRRSGARASPSSSATVRRAALRVRRARSSARRGCVGLYGFDVRGPAAFPRMQVHYWKNVLDILRNTFGAEVFVTSVPPCVSPPSLMSPALMTCPQACTGAA